MSPTAFVQQPVADKPTMRRRQAKPYSVLQKLSSRSERQIRACAKAPEGSVSASAIADELELLQKVNDAQRRYSATRRRILEVAALALALALLVGLSLVKVRSVAIDLEVRATGIQFVMNSSRSMTLVPGETGQILYLKSATIAGFDSVSPVELGDRDSIELRELKLQRGAARQPMATICPFACRRLPCQ